MLSMSPSPHRRGGAALCGMHCRGSADASFPEHHEHLSNSADADPAAAVDAFRKAYISVDHLGTPGKGCSAAALRPDPARSGDSVRKAFGDGVSRLVEELERGKSSTSQQRTDALRDLALLVGAMVLARGADEILGNEILLACSVPPAITS